MWKPDTVMFLQGLTFDVQQMRERGASDSALWSFLARRHQSFQSSVDLYIKHSAGTATKQEYESRFKRLRKDVEEWEEPV